jgi:hypothetical protein
VGKKVLAFAEKGLRVHDNQFGELGVSVDLTSSKIKITHPYIFRTKKRYGQFHYNPAFSYLQFLQDSEFNVIAVSKYYTFTDKRALFFCGSSSSSSSSPEDCDSGGTYL